MTHYRRLASIVSPSVLGLVSLTQLACSGRSGGGGEEPKPGDTEFESAPPAGAVSFGGDGASTGGAESQGAPASDASRAGNAGGPERKVEETDLYRVEGNRLYYLNGYRGLMVFDVTNVDDPKFLGRSAIFGSPVEMIVRDGVATVVVADWYGTMENGAPFRGSIVRGLDARDPTNIKVLGEARLGGWVRDTRVVGDVLYAVSQDYGWSYGWYGGYGGDVAVGSPGGVGARTDRVIVSSVSFAGGKIEQKGKQDFDGWGGVFHVTRDAILLARPTQSSASPTTELQYIDIRDPAGTIALKGASTVPGMIEGWGTDNGRWNLDFADGRYAHVITNQNGSLNLSTVDFADPAAPKSLGNVTIPESGWSAAARFAGNRLYLSPSNYYWGPNGTAETPIQVFDLQDPSAPKFAGAATIQGSVWNFTPTVTGSGEARLFALGNDWSQGSEGTKISLRYLDVSDAANPKVLGNAEFGEGWTWSPAAQTFKAFAKNDDAGLVALPFSGWSWRSNNYNNGVQLIEFSPNSIRSAGAANTRGWVERGIFVSGRVLSLSDLSLSVIDYSNRDAPRTVKEIALARNVVDLRPMGDRMAQLSTDWWGNDRTSHYRVTPMRAVSEDALPALTELDLAGSNAQAFQNGALTYVRTSIQKERPCPTTSGGEMGAAEPMPGGRSEPQKCFGYTDAVHVIDTSSGTAKLRSTIELPLEDNSYGRGWGFWGCYWYDWWWGSDAVRVGNKLAFRRTSYRWNPTGMGTTLTKLYVVDLANPDAPAVKEGEIIADDKGWWGNMQAAGDRLYLTHYEWRDAIVDGRRTGWVKYYLDEVNVDGAPTVVRKVNIPGVYVGSNPDDPNEIYTADYRWNDTNYSQVKSYFAVSRLEGDRARLVGYTGLDGHVGNVFVRKTAAGLRALTSIQRYQWIPYGPDLSNVRLADIDLTNPSKLVVRNSQAEKGWGWLLGVEGDRAIMTSGWGPEGVDLYKVGTGTPTFDKFVRTRGWGASDLARQGQKLFVASSYWGVQQIDL